MVSDAGATWLLTQNNADGTDTMQYVYVCVRAHQHTAWCDSELHHAVVHFSPRLRHHTAIVNTSISNSHTLAYNTLTSQIASHDGSLSIKETMADRLKHNVSSFAHQKVFDAQSCVNCKMPVPRCDNACISSFNSCKITFSLINVK